MQTETEIHQGHALLRAQLSERERRLVAKLCSRPQGVDGEATEREVLRRWYGWTDEECALILAWIDSI